MNRRTFLTTFSALTAFGAAACAVEPPQAEIQSLIERLGSRKFAQREKASKALMSVGKTALPALEKAAKSQPDAEVRRRADSLVTALEKKLGLGPGLVRTFTGHKAEVNSVAFSPDGRQALSASQDRTVRLWDVATGRQQLAFDFAKEQVAHVVWSPTGRHAFLGGSNGLVLYLAMPSGKEVWRSHGGAHVSAVALSPDGRWALSGDVGGTTRLWGVATGKVQKKLRGEYDFTEVWSVAFVPGGRYALSVGGLRQVHKWDLTTGKAVDSLDCGATDVFGLGVSADGKLAVTGDSYGLMTLWDVKTCRKMRQCQAQKRPFVISVVLSRDSARVLSAGTDHSVKLWDASTGKELWCFQGHTEVVQSVCFSPDGRMALSGSWDKTLKLWRLPR